MNKQILKFAKKSGATLNEGFDGNKNFVYGITMSPEELSKFAELIVRECATAIIQDSRLNDVRSAANGCVRTIREHFGVE